MTMSRCASQSRSHLMEGVHFQVPDIGVYSRFVSSRDCRSQGWTIMDCGTLYKGSSARYPTFNDIAALTCAHTWTPSATAPLPACTAMPHHPSPLPLPSCMHVSATTPSSHSPNTIPQNFDILHTKAAA